MKLYATVTSERASKGQGGNKQLDTLYTIGEARAPFLALNMDVRDDNTVLIQLMDYRADRIAFEKIVPLDQYKGKQQKGEVYCETHPNVPTENRNGWRYCPECKQ